VLRLSGYGSFLPRDARTGIYRLSGELAELYRLHESLPPRFVRAGFRSQAPQAADAAYHACAKTCSTRGGAPGAFQYRRRRGGGAAFHRNQLVLYESENVGRAQQYTRCTKRNSNKSINRGESKFLTYQIRKPQLQK
jgi:hypothetical protein